MRHDVVDQSIKPLLIELEEDVVEEFRELFSLKTILENLLKSITRIMD